MRKSLLLILLLSACTSYPFSDNVVQEEEEPTSKVDVGKQQYYTIISKFTQNGIVSKSYSYAGPFPPGLSCGLSLMTAIGMIKMGGFQVVGSCSNDIPPGWNDPIEERKM